MSCESAESFNRLSIPQAAVAYTRYGFGVVPVRHRSKAPLNSGWPNTR